MIDTLEDGIVLPQDEPYSFSALDRCDGGYFEQAYHRATKDGKELLLCNHHYRASEDKLFLEGWTVESDVSALNRLGNPLDVSPV